MLNLKLKTEMTPGPPHICEGSPGHRVEQSLFESADEPILNASRQKQSPACSKYRKYKFHLKGEPNVYSKSECQYPEIV